MGLDSGRRADLGALHVCGGALALLLVTVLGCDPSPRGGMQDVGQGGRGVGGGPLAAAPAGGGAGEGDVCDDGDPCTVDAPLLGVGAPCAHTPACDDGDPCTVDTCVAGEVEPCGHAPIVGCKTCDPGAYKGGCTGGYSGCKTASCLPAGGGAGVCRSEDIVGLSWSSTGFGGDVYYYCPFGVADYDTGEIPPPKTCAVDGDCPAGALCAVYPGGDPVCTPTLAVEALAQASLVEPIPTPVPIVSHQATAACASAAASEAPWTPQGPCLAEVGVRRRWEKIRAEVASPDGWFTLLKSAQIFPVAEYADGKSSLEQVRLAASGPEPGTGASSLLPTRFEDDVLDVAPRAKGGATVLLRYAWHPGIRPLVARTLDASGATVCEQGLTAASPEGSLSCSSGGGMCPPGGRLRAVTLNDGQVLVAWTEGSALHTLVFTPCGGVSSHRILPLSGRLFGLAPWQSGASLATVTDAGRVYLLRLDSGGAPQWRSTLRTGAGHHHALAAVGKRAIVSWAGGCEDRAVSTAWFDPTGAVAHEQRVGVPGPVSDVQMVSTGADLLVAAASIRSVGPATIVARLDGAGHLLWAREVRRAIGTLAALRSDAVVLLDPLAAPQLLAEDAAGNLFARRAAVLPGDGVLPATCTAPGQLGSACGRGNPHCGSGLVCQKALGNVCAPPAVVGVACANDADCQAPATCAADFDLYWFTCMLADFGAYFKGYPDYCGAQTCENIKRCRAPAAFAKACGLGGVCESGLVCTMGNPPDASTANLCPVPGGTYSCWHASP